MTSPEPRVDPAERGTDGEPPRKEPPAGEAPEGKRPTGTWRHYPPDPSEEGHTVVGDLRVFEGFHSPQLGNRRDVLLYLPASYEAGTRRYPVLYMQDGQNLFDEAIAFAAEWRVDETMDALGRERGLEAIVVGVSNTGEHRLGEYSPFEDAEHGGGRGDRYLDFLVDTLKPRVDRDFRTLTDRANTLIAGSSMGGLISLYAFFRRPDVFGGAGVMSPALWFADRSIFPFVEAAPFAPGRLYLDVGTKEGTEAVANVRRMGNVLLRKGYRAQQDFLYVEQVRAGHTEKAWRKRFRRAAPFLLSAAR